MRWLPLPWRTWQGRSCYYWAYAWRGCARGKGRCWRWWRGQWWARSIQPCLMRRWNPNQYKQRNHVICNSLRMLMITYTGGTPKTTARVMHMISIQLYHRWNPTEEKSQSNATNVILSPFRLHLFGSNVWEHISKHTLEKSQANAANHQWGFVSSNTSILKRHLRKHAVGKNTNKWNQCQYAFQAIWGDIWKHTGEKSNKCPQWDFFLLINISIIKRSLRLLA